MKPKLIVALALLLAMACARADWIDPGAAYLCKPSFGFFSIVSVMSTSGSGQVDAPAGYTTLTENKSVPCNLGDTKMVTEFHIRPPQATGMCGGLTQIHLALSINGKEVFAPREIFNQNCMDGQSLHSVFVNKTANEVRIEICRADWDWEVGYHDIHCIDVSLL